MKQRKKSKGKREREREQVTQSYAYQSSLLLAPEHALELQGHGYSLLCVNQPAVGGLSHPPLPPSTLSDKLDFDGLWLQFAVSEL